ncbi:dienelactone hydrolase family protein [Maricaulaceae bacterium MS644]
MRALAVCLAALCLQGGAAAQDRLADHVEIRLPEDAAGPVPAALLFSGCGGVQPVQTDYAETALEQGWAAVIVDSHAARGIGRLAARSLVCTGLRLRGQDRAADVFEALQIVRADPRLDANRTVLAGWSHGGWTVLDAMAQVEADAETEDQPFAGVAAALLIYPYCGMIIQADTSPIGDPFPVTLLLVGKDRIANPEDCRRLAGRREAEGTEIDIVFEPELTHAFDAAEQPWDPRMDYDADGAQRARALFSEILEAAGD